MNSSIRANRTYNFYQEELENKIKSIVTEMKFWSKKVDGYVFDKDKLTEKSNKIYEILYKAGFKSQHLENNNKKEGWYLDVFYR